MPLLLMFLAVYCSFGFAAAQNTMLLYDDIEDSRWGAGVEIKPFDKVKTTAIAALLPFHDLDFIAQFSGLKNNTKAFWSNQLLAGTVWSGPACRVYLPWLYPSYYSNHASNTDAFLNSYEDFFAFLMGNRSGQSLFLDQMVGIPWLFTIITLAPLGFLVLPQSRRRAKVKLKHIVRIYLYSLVSLPFALFVFAISLGCFGMRSFWGTSNTFEIALNMTCFIFLAFIGIWWWTATSRYLKMRHGFGVGVWCLLLGAGVSAAIGSTQYLS